MAFLNSFSNPNYENANIYQFERKRKEPRAPMFEYDTESWDRLRRPIGRSRGMIDQVGQSRTSSRNPTEGLLGVNPTAGLLGIQNTTGFAQQAPNVVYDPGPEQFAQQMRMRKDAALLDQKNLEAENLVKRDSDLADWRQKERALGIQERNAEALTGLKVYDADTRRMSAEGRVSSADERNAIAAFRAMNPNLLIRPSAGGTYHAIHPQTGEVTDTGISVGNMTQEAAINLRNKGALEQIGARGDEAIEAIGARGNAQKEVADAAAEAAMQRLLMGGYLDSMDSRGMRKFFENQTKILPNQMSGFEAKPNEFEARPGQFIAAPGQFTPGTQANKIATEGGQPGELRAQAIQQLRADGKPVNEKTIEWMMSRLNTGTKSSATGTTTPEAGKSTGTPAGQLTGKPAGQVR